jgi:hypothetical protein
MKKLEELTFEMDERLEEINRKFDVVYEDLGEESETLVVNCLGSMREHSHLQEPFDDVFDVCLYDLTYLKLFNVFLKRRKISPLTKSDLEYVYERMGERYSG